MIPFLSGHGGVRSTTYADGSPAQVGVVSFGEVFTAGLSGGLDGTLAIPRGEQYGITVPVNCMLDTICVTVGSPAFHSAPAQTIHAFAILATAAGDSQKFTLHPATKAEVILRKDEFRSAKVHTVRATELRFALAAETRCMLVCGHYVTGKHGSTEYNFTYSGTLLFK